MSIPSTENEKLIFSKLVYLRDEYSKIEFNYEFLIQEAIKYKNIYENLKESINYQEKKLKWTIDFKEFIEIKIYTFEIQLQYFIKFVEEIKDDYKKMDNFNLKDNHYIFVLNYVEKIQNINKNFYDKIKEINLPKDYIKYNPKYNRDILPHKQIDNYFLDNIKKLERLELIKINYSQKYFDLLFNEYSIENQEEYQNKRNQFVSDVNKIISNLNTFFELLKTNYVNGGFKTKINPYSNSFPILFIIKKNIKLTKEFYDFI